MPLICENIGFAYPDAHCRLFTGVSFQFPEPGFHAFFGPSGVGKTTLAKIIAGEIPEFSGTIFSKGISTILYSYNLERLPGWSSVKRHLERICAPSMASQKDALVEIFGLSPCMHSRFAKLSLGQQNRVNLVRYLLQEWDLLIMDESLANVDELTRERIILNIKQIFDQKYFIYISHNIMEIAKFCDDILVFGTNAQNVHTTRVKGRNLKLGQSLSRAQLDATLLEIMNAA